MVNTLFVAGSFDLNGGRTSGLAEKMASHMTDVDFYNGGHYDELQNLLDSVISYKRVYWFANVPNDLPKVRNVKELNPKAILIPSKRNDGGKYPFKEVVKRALLAKANLLFEFSKTEGIFNIRIIDPLGCVWYNGTDIEQAVKAAEDRLNTLEAVKRMQTITGDNDNTGTKIEPKFIEKRKEMLEVTKNYSEVFYQILDADSEYNFRCAKGMPSFRYNDKIYVSIRDIDKRHIEAEDFVNVYEKGGKIYCSGDKKPSVDTPVHVRLYHELPNINCIIHAHCYIKDAPMTKTAYPCGALQEADEILKIIGGDKNKGFYAINELGHGSILMASDIEKLAAEYYPRPIPETI